MKTGELNRWVSLQNPINTTNSIGGVTGGYAVTAQCWAKITPVDGSYLTRHGIMESSNGAVIYIRYYTAGLKDITKKTRIHYNSEVFQVRSVVNENGNDEFFKIIASKNE